MRGLANQRDIDIELTQFRDVITAGREVLHVDVPERIKHPPPVPAAVARNGRYLHEQPFATLSRSTEPRPASQAFPLQASAPIPASILGTVFAPCCPDVPVSENKVLVKVTAIP